MNTGALLKEIKSNPEAMGRLLKPPGVFVSEINVKDLVIEVMPSGFPTLDEYMLLKRGRSELVVVGGRTSHGKSAFMFQLGFNVAHYVPVHIISLEMTKEQIMTRMLSGIVDRPIGAIQKGLVSEKELEKAKEKIKDLKLIIDDESGLNVAQISDRIRGWKKSANIGLVIIDYLQLINSDQTHNRSVAIGNNTKALKTLAKELQIPIIVGSQLNRQNEIRGKSSGDYRPVLSDLAESGSIENDCDVALFVHRESRYTQLRSDEADILIVKNRMGVCGDVVMKYFGAQTRFVDVGDIEI
jgi:replicative DNA helicase